MYCLNSGTDNPSSSAFHTAKESVSKPESQQNSPVKIVSSELRSYASDNSLDQQLQDYHDFKKEQILKQIGQQDDIIE
jgi:hypothetical protein